MGHAFHDALACVVRRRATGGDHVTRHDAEHVHDETSGIGPGPSGCRDGVGTRRGTSHNNSFGFSRAVEDTPDLTELSSSTSHWTLALDKPISGW